MAELNVQPKKKTSVLPWILLLLGVIAFIWFLSNRNKDKTLSTDKESNSATTVPNTAANISAEDWNSIDFNAPAVDYDEVPNKNINVRSNNNYGIYSLGENILFDEGKAFIRSEAEENLKQITGSINKRYNGGKVRVYGFTDATGSAEANKELAQKRADAVKVWLQNNGIDAGRISESAPGEAQPLATNNTEEGRKQNRRVEIVARGGSATQ